MTVFYYTLEFVNKNTKSNFFETSFADVSCETRPYNLMCKDEQFLKVNQNWV